MRAKIRTKFRLALIFGPRLVTKDRGRLRQPSFKLKCLNLLRLEAGDSRLQNESPWTKGGEGALVGAG
jgi:hypothetical protein